jgi:predicted alpha/beta hydrolase
VPVRDRPVAVLAPGSGSTAAFVVAAFGGPLSEAGFELVALDDRTGDIEAATARLAALVDEVGASLVGGVSLGAHAAVRVAATRPQLRGALLVLPAWTGPPGAVAALSARAAAEVAEHGVAGVLARLPGSSWVGAELARAWPTYTQDDLVAALLATSRSTGPTTQELAAVAVPAAVVAVVGDPYHPEAVARAWAGILPTATLTVLAPTAPDVPVELARAGVAGWLELASRDHGSKR